MFISYVLFLIFTL